MAFCNHCGAVLIAGDKVCGKCGAAAVASSSAPAPTTPVSAAGAVSVPPSKQGWGAGKLILVIVALCLGLMILALVGIGFVGWRIAHRTHVHQDGSNVKIETPFGVVESTKDPEQAARSIGVDIYPGAQVVKDGAMTSSFGNVRTTAASFVTGDSFDKVSSFYKNKFPNATVSASSESHCTIVSSDPKNIVTINIQAADGQTKIQLSSVSHGSEAGPSN